MLARLRISVPDRPGSLGRITTAIGAAGGDIAGLDVLESKAGRALDDVFVTVRDSAHLDVVTAAVAGTSGAEVVGVQQPAPPVTRHTDLELVQQVLTRPERGVQTLVDGAPAALGADWAAVLAFDAMGAATGWVARSLRAPATDPTLAAPLRLGAVGLADPATETPYAGAALVPLGGEPLGLLLVRIAGLGFHPAELFRLGQLGSVLGAAVTVVA